LLRHSPKTKRPTTIKALYSGVNSANPNLRPSVEKAPQENFRQHNTKTTAVTRPKHIMTPLKFDGTTSFKTFWAQFQNCVRHNRWDRSTKLVYLRNSLNKDVANVLWNYGKEMTESLSGLTKILKMRFGGKTFADKHCIEIRNRRRQNGET